MNGRLLCAFVLPALAALVCVQSAAAQPETPVNDSTARAKDLAKRIDETIIKKLQAAKVKPAPLASDTEFFRRLVLDLTGQIPTLLEVRNFLEKENPDKRSEWIENLLESDRYPVHFSYVWRGIILSKRAENNLVNSRQSFERWMQNRLNQNQGYDLTTKELLNLVRKPGEPGSPNAFTAFHGNKAEDQAGAVSRVFLGVSIECAQCHAHPFADWTKQQFWEFAAFFNPQGVKSGGIGFQRPQIVIPGSGKLAKGTFLDGTEPPAGSLVPPRAVAANWIATKENPFFAKATADHVWAYFFGVSLWEPLQEQDPAGITHPELLDLLAKELADSDFDLKHLIRAILYTQAYQRTTKSVAGDEEALALFARMPVRALSADQLFDSLMVATYSKFQEPSTPQYIDVDFLSGQNLSERNQFLVKFADMAKATESSTSILQALFLMNNKFLNDRISPKNNQNLKILAVTASTKRQIETLYLLALSRFPTAQELQQLTGFVESGGPTGNRAQALADVLWALLNSSEFALNH